MSIASRITSIENHIEEAYTEISRLGVDLTNVDKNIDNIADKLQEAYSQSPKVTDEGSSLSLSPTRKGGLTIIPKGACEQDSYSGKQLINRTTCLENKGLTWVDGNVVSSTNNLTTDYFEIEINQNYTNNYVGGIFFYDNSKTYLGAYQEDGSIAKVGSNFRGNTFLVPNNNDIKYARIVFRGGWNDNINILTANVQTEKGSTITSWEPYTGGIPAPNPDYPQDIRVVTGDNSVVVQNKNLYKGNNSTFYLKNVKITRSNDGTKLILNGTATETGSTLIDYTFNIDKRLIGNIVSYSCVASDTTTPYKMWYGFFKEGGTPVNTFDGMWDINGKMTGNYKAENKEMNTTAVKYRTVIGVFNGVAYNNFEIDLQIELGQVATSFQPYQEQTYTLHLGTNYLAGIGTYKDEIVGKTDEWKIKRKIRKITYNGSEPWEMYGTSSTSAGRFQIQNGYFKSPATNVVAPIMCDKLITYRKSGLAYGGISGADEDVFRMLVKISADITTVEQLKTWLSSNPLVVYHKLNTYTETTITDTTLISDLNNIYQAMGYDGTTNITITSGSNNAQMTASVSALKGE